MSDDEWWRSWGDHVSTTDPGVIDAWWRCRPDSLVGAQTGAVSGVVVLDVDQREDVDGEATLRRLEDELGELPPTVAQTTPSGGRQLVFAYPDGVEKITTTAHIGRSDPREKTGLDVRADGGQVVLPPSRRAGGVYRWRDGRGPHELDPAPLPAGWVERLRGDREPEPPPASRVYVARAREGTHPWCARMFDDAIDELAAMPRDSGRNARLFWAARRLYEHERHIAPGSIEPALWGAAQSNGLVDDDGERSVRATIESGARAGRAAPKDPPARPARRAQAPPGGCDDAANGPGPGPEPESAPAPLGAAQALERAEPVIRALADFEGEPDHGAIVRALEPVRALRLTRDGRAAVRERLITALRGAGISAPAALADAFLPLPRGGRGGDDDDGSQAGLMTELARSSGVELFHTSDEREYLTATVGDHAETWPVRSRATKGWLRRLHHEKTGKPPGGQGVTDAVDQLAADALLEGEERELGARVSGDGEVVRLDLGDERWTYVEITAAGWEVRPGAAQYFRRSRGMESLPAPERGGSLTALRPHLNAADDDVWHLLVAWLIGTLRPRGPYPVLIVLGEHGSAKTTTCKMLRRIVDPGKAGLRTPPKELRDLAIAAEGHHVVGYDNLGALAPGLSDGLCRLATGSGFATRQLYTDDDEVIFAATRPILANGISEVATRPDLLDRAYVVTLPRFGDDHDQRPDSEVWSAFEADLPGILGGLCDAVSMALRRWAETPAVTGVRMQDSLRWAEASTPQWTEPGAPTAAVRRSRAEASASTVESSPVARAVTAMLDARAGEPWVGSASELLDELTAEIGDQQAAQLIRKKRWPTSARGLTAQLTRLAPVLRAEGIHFDRLDRRGRYRPIRLAREGAARPSQPSRPSSSDENANDSGSFGYDGCDDDVMTVDDGVVRPSSDRHRNRHRANAQNHSGDDGGDGCDGCAPPFAVAEPRRGGGEWEVL